MILSAQVNADFAAIVSSVNTNAAHSGVNSDITQLVALTSLTASGNIATTGNLTAASGTVSGAIGSFPTLQSSGTATFGTAVITGTETVNGVLTANAGAVIAGGNLNVTGFVEGTNLITTQSAQIGTTLSVAGTTTLSGNLVAASPIFTGVAVADTFYNSLQGAIITSPGAGVRAANTVSGRVSFTASGFTNAFGISNVVNAGTGVYNFTFNEALLNTNYQVTSSAVAAGSGLIFGVVTTKTTTGFSLTYETAAGTPTSLTGPSSDVIVAGGN